MSEKLALIMIVMIILIVISDFFSSIIFSDTTTDKQDQEPYDYVSDMLAFFDSQEFLGNFDTNVSDISTKTFVYKGVASCAFIYLQGEHRCYVSGSDEKERLALLEIMSQAINDCYDCQKMMWIKPHVEDLYACGHESCFRA